MKSRNCKLQIANCKLQIAIACVFVLMPTLVIAAPFTFDDIDYWVGTGSNRAAFVIDWVENSTEPPALVWGYRWDGTANGRDMLTAIVAADDRLFAKLGDTSANPVAVYGLGYDADDDGEFALDDDTAFDADGIAFTRTRRREACRSMRPTSTPKAGSLASGTTASRRRIRLTAAVGRTSRSAWRAASLRTAPGIVGHSRRHSISPPSPRILSPRYRPAGSAIRSSRRL